MGATHACDVALIRPCYREAKYIFFSNHVHESIRQSIAKSAAIISGFTGNLVGCRELVMDAWLGDSPGVFADRVTEAVTVASGGAPSLLVLEHVTSQLGLRFPVAEVEAALRKIGNCSLIIDGAQAVGLWPVTTASRCVYFGSFHKYLDAPAGCGFAVLPGLDASSIPHSAGAMTWSGIAEGGEALPTQDLNRWRECRAALHRLTLTEENRRKVLGLRSTMIEGLPNGCIVPHVSADSDYRSHLVAVSFPNPQAARDAWTALFAAGHETKLQDDTIRVSLHHSVSKDELASCLMILRSSLSS